MALPTVTITGTVRGPSGAAATSGTITVRLSSPGTAQDSGTLADDVVNGSATWTLAAGAVPALSTLVPNEEITPLGGVLGATRYFALYECVIGGRAEKWEEVWYVTSAPAIQEVGDLAAQAAAIANAPTQPVDGYPLSEILGGTGTTSLSAGLVTATGSTTPRTLADVAAQSWPRDFLSGLAALTVQVSSGASVAGVAFVRRAWDATYDLVEGVYLDVVGSVSNNIVQRRAAERIPIATLAANTQTAWAASGARLAIQGDEEGPPNWNGDYLGGHHGLYLRKLTLTGHGLTAEDVGSIWQDAGAKRWTVVRIDDANTFWIMPENTGTLTAWTFPTAIGSQPLTHVSGATHTSNLAFTASSALPYVTAVFKNVKTMYLDDAPITTNGVFTGKEFRIEEVYEVPNFASALRYIQKRVGSNPAPSIVDPIIDSQIRVESTWRWTSLTGCTHSAKWTILQPVTLSTGGLWGVSQMNPPSYGGGDTLHLYVPKTIPFVAGGVTYNLAGVEDITALANQLNLNFATPSTWLDANVPPDMTAEVVKTGGVKQYGMAQGYQTWLTDGTPARRKVLTSQAGYITAAEKKMYLLNVNAQAGALRGAGTVWQASMHRAYWPASALPEATVFYVYLDDFARPVVVAHFHESVTGLALPLPAAWAGATVSVYESSGATVLDSVVAADGHVHVTVAGTYGYVVLKLT